MQMDFFCVYVKTRKKLDKYIKVNRIRNKYIIDIKKIMEEEEISFDKEKTYLKIIIFQKIQQAIDKNKSGRNGPVIRRMGIATTIYSK